MGKSDCKVATFKERERFPSKCHKGICELDYLWCFFPKPSLNDFLFVYTNNKNM